MNLIFITSQLALDGDEMVGDKNTNCHGLQIAALAVQYGILTLTHAWGDRGEGGGRLKDV